VDADGEVVEVESYGEGTDYLALFGGEGGGELECHALIFGVVAEELHCGVEAQGFRIIHIEVLINTYIPGGDVPVGGVVTGPRGTIRGRSNGSRISLAMGIDSCCPSAVVIACCPNVAGNEL
jgi:hypothetical protein